MKEKLLFFGLQQLQKMLNVPPSLLVAANSLKDDLSRRSVVT